MASTHTVHATPLLKGTLPEQYEENFPPAILGMLDPPASRQRKVNGKRQLLDAAGQPIFHPNGRPVNDLPSLPRDIETVPNRNFPPPLMVEFWTRMDPDVEYEDINARLPPTMGLWTHMTPSPGNALNMARMRLRRIMGGRSWARGDSQRSRNQVCEVVSRLSKTQIDFNTTW